MDSASEAAEQAIGRGARQLREQAGVTLDQLATRAREYGLRWSTARVLEFERGRMRFTLPVVLVVAQSLGGLIGRPVAISELLASDGPAWVQVSDEWITTRTAFRRLLSGEALAAPHVVEVGGDWSPIAAAIKPSAQVDDMLIATLAEERLARRLDVRPRQVAMWSHMLWGHHLDDEVMARAGSDATPQARGHVSRELARDIEENIAAYAGEHDGNG